MRNLRKLIKLEQLPNGLKLYYKDYLFFHHTKENPCFTIGEGKAKFKMQYGGTFKIKQKSLNKYPLTNFRIITESKKLIEIEFEGGGVKLKVTFAVSDVAPYSTALILTPKCSHSEINRFWIRIVASPSEAIYGCGEQYSELNLRGKIVPLWVEEQGIGRGDPNWLTKLLNGVGAGGDWYTTYFPQPTFVSTENYFWHVETTNYAEFNFKDKNSHELQIWGIPNKIIIGKYDSALETVGKLSDLLGRQPELPEWIMDGVILGIQGGTEIVTEKINRCLEKDTKINAVWCQDWQGIRMTNFGKRLFWNWVYNDELYGELPKFINSLNEKDIKFLGYINSFLSTDGALYKDAAEKNLCVKKKDGSDYFIKTGNGKTALLDLTNPETIE